MKKKINAKMLFFVVVNAAAVAAVVQLYSCKKIYNVLVIQT